jgi:cysteine desulfurase
MIYLDNNATTALDPDVAEAMFACFLRGPLNASSQHAIGRAARNLLDQAISEIGSMLNADVDSPGGDQLILTSGGSESNNLALTGIGDASAPLVVSAIEHPSVLAVASAMQAAGREVRVIAALASGEIDIEAAKKVITRGDRPALVSVMAANNETGVIQPLEAVAEICRDAGVPLHIDATQTIGKFPFDFAKSGAAAVTMTAHKFHGPAGIGALLVRRGVALKPLMLGGEQQLGKRPGTEAVPLAVGMAKALTIALRDHSEVNQRVKSIRDQFESSLRQTVDTVLFHGVDSERLPGTSCFSLPGVDRQNMLMALDLAGVACSSGSACASGSSRPSHVLEAMGLATAAVESSLRVGFSKFSTMADAEQATAIISNQYRRLRRLAAVENSN